MKLLWYERGGKEKGDKGKRDEEWRRDIEIILLKQYRLTPLWEQKKKA